MYGMHSRGCSLCLAVMISMMCCWHSNTFPAEAGGTQCASCNEVTVMQEIKSSLGVEFLLSDPVLGL